MRDGSAHTSRALQSPALLQNQMFDNSGSVRRGLVQVQGKTLEWFEKPYANTKKAPSALR
jgi:hypothetical protein